MGRHGMAAIAALFGLVASATAATAAPMPTDPDFPGNGWSTAIHWTPPDPNFTPMPIAIVDTGMLPGSEDFTAYLDDTSVDCAGRSTPVRATTPGVIADQLGHGTQVATLAAAPANGLGSVGVSPNSPPIIVRVTRDGSDYSGIPCAFRYLEDIARQGQPLVVNLSFSVEPRGTADRQWLARLVKAGALVVAAAGNGATVTWPASDRHVLAVGRVDRAGAHGPALDVTAPGASLMLPHLDGVWRTGDTGTSYAAPIVAGLAARIWGRYENIDNPQQVAWVLRQSASGRGRASAIWGFGQVDMAAAFRTAASAIPRIEESEPNDDRGTAQRISCRRTCALRGLVVKTDDPVDVWKLGRRRCPRLRASGLAISCKRVRGVAYVRVRATASTQRAYTLRVRR